MHLPRIGVLRGGPSSEYEVSLGSGAAVLSALRERLRHLYHARDILIDRTGKWHIDGVPCLPQDLCYKVDAVFNALHGTYGEDGTVQSFLETHGVPFTGSGSLGSAVGMNKVISKRIFADHGIASPYWRTVLSERMNTEPDTVIEELFNSCIMPVVVKPASSGSSVGVSIVRDHTDLHKALLHAASHGATIIIEEYIPGIEATCGVIEGFRGHDLYALPPVEIRPHSGFFDYEAKYAGKSEEIVPATFAESIKRAIEDIAMRVHRAFGLKHYSRTDMIIHPRRGIYVLEVNTLPGLTVESLVPKALRAVGSDVPEFVDHVIQIMLKKT